MLTFLFSWQWNWNGWRWLVVWESYKNSSSSTGCSWVIEPWAGGTTVKFQCKWCFSEMSHLPVTCASAISLQLFVCSQNSAVIFAFVKKKYLHFKNKHSRDTSLLKWISININKIASFLSIDSFLSFTWEKLVMLYMP